MDLLSELEQNLSGFKSNRWVLAFSGGLDSQVLLHALTKLRDPADLTAVHVNHNIHPQAANWQQHCKAQCEALGVTFIAESVSLSEGSKESLEEAARHLRYEALAKHLDKESVLLTAHHRDDQAETVLLRLFRGAGVRGLQGMLAEREIEGHFRLRPLLNRERAEILSYANTHQLHWIEDPSNADTRIRRNHLRADVLPLIKQYWPSITNTLSTCAMHMQESQDLLDELAEIDWLKIKQRPFNRVSLAPFLLLSEHRQKNLLRWWLDSQNTLAPPASALTDFLRQLHTAEARGKMELRWGAHEMKVYQGALVFRRDGFKVNLADVQAFTFVERVTVNSLVTLICRERSGFGLRVPQTHEIVTLAYRKGGERCRFGKRKTNKSLKEVFQEHDIPTWLRAAWPLIYYDDVLVAVPGLWFHDGYACNSEAHGLQLSVELDF